MDKTSEKLLESFAKALVMVQKAPSGTPVNPYYTGPGGIFGTPGVERDLFSTRIHPIGIASSLPILMTDQMNPMFGYITGFVEGSGSEPEAVCDAAPVAGPMKTCYQTAQFGRFTRQTRELELNRLGQRTDRSELSDFVIVNDPLAPELGAALFPNLPAASQAIAGREVLARQMELGIDFQNWFMTRLYTGNPANNTASGGYKEFPGLDILIGTNKFDALTGTSCPSLQSIIRNANSREVSTNGSYYVREIADICRRLVSLASRMNMGTVQWEIVMRESLFHELTAIWPCEYLTDRCSSAAADFQLVVTGTENVAMRDAMRNGHYLLVDGVQWPVKIDDAIAEDSGYAGGCFESDIYWLPMTVRNGSIPVLYWEFFDYTKGVVPGINDSRTGYLYWTDGGKYLWTTETKLWCLTQTVKTEPRLILKTPHLAARLQNVRYCPASHEREPFPDQPYFVDGGVQGRTAPSLYSDWNTPR
ncbi:MAG: hypothetical protein QUS07_07365 [Methanothrix sp.]|nr:hypothetical protein [Methanothrix sp.]